MAVYDPSTPDEIWYPIPSVREYQLSSDFNVRTSRKYVAKHRRTKEKWRSVPVYYPEKGYPYFNATLTGPRGSYGVRVLIHRVVLEIALGKARDDFWVLHYDDDKMNFYPSNLRYGMPSENRLDAIRNKAQREGKEVSKTTGFVPDWNWSEGRAYWPTRT